MSLRGRLEHLEQRLRRFPTPEECSRLAREVRAIDETIARLDGEIAESEARMPPEEVQRVRLEHEADAASLEGLTLDEKVAALDRRIAKLNAEIEEETKERSETW